MVTASQLLELSKQKRVGINRTLTYTILTKNYF